MNLICPTCKTMRENWKLEKMEALIKAAREKAIEIGKTVAIIKESSLDFEIIDASETQGRNVIQYITNGS